MTSLKFIREKPVDPKLVRDCCGSFSMHVIHCSACMAVLCRECANFVEMCEIVYCDDCYVEEEREVVYSMLHCGHCRMKKKEGAKFVKCPAGNPVCKTYCGCGHKCYLNSARGQSVKRSYYVHRQSLITNFKDSKLIRQMNDRDKCEMKAKQRRRQLKKKVKKYLPKWSSKIKIEDSEKCSDVPRLEVSNISWVIDNWTCDPPESISKVKLRCTMCDRNQILRVLRCHTLHVALCPNHKYWMDEYPFPKNFLYF